MVKILGGRSPTGRSAIVTCSHYDSRCTKLPRRSAATILSPARTIAGMIGAPPRPSITPSRLDDDGLRRGRALRGLDDRCSLILLRSDLCNATLHQGDHTHADRGQATHSEHRNRPRRGSISVGLPPTAHALHPESAIAGVPAAAVDADKAAAFDWVDRNAEMMKAIGADLWGTPELSFREFKSSRTLIRYLEGNGFTVTTGVADMPTTFVHHISSRQPMVRRSGRKRTRFAGMSQRPAPTRRAHRRRRDPVIVLARSSSARTAAAADCSRPVPRGGNRNN